MEKSLSAHLYYENRTTKKLIFQSLRTLNMKIDVIIKSLIKILLSHTIAGAALVLLYFAPNLQANSEALSLSFPAIFLLSPLMPLRIFFENSFDIIMQASIVYLGVLLFNLLILFVLNKRFKINPKIKEEPIPRRKFAEANK